MFSNISRLSPLIKPAAAAALICALLVTASLNRDLIRDFIDKNTNNNPMDEITLNDKGNNTLSDANPFVHISDADIRCISREGGLPSTTGWKVLYPGRDSDKIWKIANLINSSSDTRKSTEEDLRFLHRRHGYPVNIVIKMKDGSEYTLERAMKMTIETTSTGTNVHGSPYDDRTILSYKKDKAAEYYTVYSRDVVEYVTRTSNLDMPRRDMLSVTPENFKYGDRIKVSGGSCSAEQVVISLIDGNSPACDEHIIGKVTPVFGAWSWEGVIDRNLKTYDGKDIDFKSNRYFLQVQFDDMVTTLVQQIIIPSDTN